MFASHHFKRFAICLAALAVALIVSAGLAHAQAVPETSEPELVVYKTTTNSEGEAVELKLHIFKPDGWRAQDQRPVIVFFFGGGWRGGTPAQFYPQCRDLADRGMVTISAEYRVQSRHGTAPVACVEDGRSAVRYIRSHAEQLGIAPDRLAAGGGSAGGHVAVCTALIDDVNAQTDDLEVSAVPNALALFNPVLDTTRETGYGGDRMGDDDQRLSPVHRVFEGQPPSIVFHGTADTTVPIESVRRFAEASRELGARCELVEYEDQGHGFFNHTDFRRNNNIDIYYDTMDRTVAFLVESGILEP